MDRLMRKLKDCGDMTLAELSEIVAEEVGRRQVAVIEQHRRATGLWPKPDAETSETQRLHYGLSDRP